MNPFYLQNFIGNSLFPFFIQYGHHDFSLDMHTHADFFELTIVLDGTALHIVDDESYFIKKGDVFVVDEQTLHGFTECRNFKICNIMFQPDIIFAPFPDLKRCSGFHSLFVLEPRSTYEHHFQSRLKLTISDFEETERLIAIMIREYNAALPGFVSIVTAYFIELVSYLVRRYDETLSVHDKITSFAKAVAYMEQNFTNPLSLAEIAGISGLSVRQFQRRFKTTYMLTPQEYLCSLRMQKAARMLTISKESVAAIAPECGYHDPNLFSRQFKKSFGVSPKQYREKEKRQA